MGNNEKNISDTVEVKTREEKSISELNEIFIFFYPRDFGYLVNPQNYLSIGFLLDWIEKNKKYKSDFCNCRIDGDVRMILQLRKFKDKNIVNQPDECIDFVYGFTLQSE